MYHYQSVVRITAFRLVCGVSLSSLIGEMEGKEREREENYKFKENRPENYHVHDRCELRHHQNQQEEEDCRH